MKARVFWPLMLLTAAALFAANLLTGAAGYSAGQVWAALTDRGAAAEIRTVVLRIRLVKTVVAVLAGAATAVSGLLMQTLFRNPLAGPYVLGVSSGASLGAALYLLGLSSGFLTAGSLAASTGLAGAAWAGAAVVLALISIAGRKIKDIMVLLILGMLSGAAIDAVVQVMQYLSDEVALKSYILWTMGSLSAMDGGRLGLLAVSVGAGLLLSVRHLKSLNLLLLGDRAAASMGMDAPKVRTALFIATVLLSGTVTAFCGPLGFIGLAAPHIARFLIQNADHKVLLPAALLTGSVLLLAAELVSGLSALPVNALTSLIGIPVILWIVIKSRRN